MDFKVEFNCDNAAFDGNPREETAAILQNMATALIQYQGDGGPIFDVNGNKIGQWSFTD